MSNSSLQKFFESRKDIALTFDDVLLKGARASFALREVSLATQFSRNVHLQVPIVGAAMSSVVGSKMAIALAKLGGIGSIPRSLDPEAQAKAVARVKHHIHGFIDEPILAKAEDTVEDLLRERTEKGWEFDSFPVLNTKGKLVGLMTHSDFKRCDNPALVVGAVMTTVEKLISAREGISLKDAYSMLKETDKNVLPVLRTDGSLAGMYTFTDLKRIMTEKTMHNVDISGQLCVAAAIGAGPEAYERAELLVAKGVDVLHIDMANGWQDFVFTTAKCLKETYKNGPDIVLGNFAQGRAAREAVDETGVDGILIGIGGGSICTTRTVTGTGVPQVSAVYECARYLENTGVPVCSDGGIRQSGDIAIALSVGADSVMVGGLIAGTEEAPGVVHRLENGQRVKDYYGMGSERAMLESAGSRQRYLQGQGVLIPEGVEGSVSYKGSVETVLSVHLGGVRKALHCNGARTIEELHEKAELNQVTFAGRVESHAHDITLSSASSGYRR